MCSNTKLCSKAKLFLACFIFNMCVSVFKQLNIWRSSMYTTT